MAQHLIDNLIGAVRFFVGLILVIIAVKTSVWAAYAQAAQAIGLHW